MSVLDRFEHQDVEGVRVGRFKGKLTTSCILYRLGGTVIDTGPTNQWPFVRTFLQEREIDSVVLTHHHEDHSGNGAHIQREMGKTALAPAKGLDQLARGFRVGPMQRLFWGRPRRFEAQPIGAEMILANGCRLRTVHTPGHSEDMTCYLEPDRGWLFSGDVYIASKPRYFRYDENIHDQIRSLEALLELDFETLLCSHRGVIEDGRASVQKKLDYLRSIRDQARDLRQQGLSIREITRQILGKEDGMTWTSLLVFSKRHMIVSGLSEER